MSLYDRLDALTETEDGTETRTYEISGNSEDLDVLEKALRHCEYLGNIGASRNILLRVDGDGSGRIKVKKATDDGKIDIDNDEYNIEQDKDAVVGVYDIG